MQLSVKDVAKLLNVTEETIYRWIKQENIPFHSSNDQCRFNRAEIIEWATARRIPLSADILTESDGSKPSPSLVDIIKTGGIVHQLSGADTPTVLRNVVDAMHLPEEVDREFLYQILLARENLGSTGIGDGIAIPHVRNPIVLHITKPMITLCFLEHPINFGAIDGEPVDTLFTLISPTVRTHLQLLSRLGFVLQNPAFKEALKKKLPSDKILEELARAESALPAIKPE